MIYDLVMIFSYLFVTVILEMVALATSWIYLMIYALYIANIDKKCDSVGQKINLIVVKPRKERSEL